MSAQFTTGYTMLDGVGGSHKDDWQNLGITLKYVVLADPEAERLVSIGLTREFGRTGAARVGAGRYGSTTPTLYFGQSFGSAPISPALQPLALTGTISYLVPDRATKSGEATESGEADPTSDLFAPRDRAAAGTVHNPQQLILGGSLQYSFGVLQTAHGQLRIPALSRPLF